MTGFSLIQACCLALGIVLALPTVACAHRPLDTSGPASRSQPIVVPDHKISWAAYSQLTYPGEVDYYRFTAKKGDRISGSMLIPKLDRLKNFSPAFALIGPQLHPAPEDKDYQQILDTKGDEDVLVAAYQGDKPKVMFEPFTQTRYWVKQALNIVAPTTGTYYLAVFDPTGDTGKYVFCIGDKEVWQAQDVLAMPRIWWQTRMFVEERWSTYIIVGALPLMSLAIAYKIGLRIKQH